MALTAKEELARKKKPIGKGTTGPRKGEGYLEKNTGKGVTKRERSRENKKNKGEK